MQPIGSSALQAALVVELKAGCVACAGVESESGVPGQPMGDEETLKGCAQHYYSNSSNEQLSFGAFRQYWCCTVLWTPASRPELTA